MLGEIDLKQFKKIRRISQGGFGFIYQIQDKKTGEFYAAKIIDCNDNKDKCNEMVNREVSILMYTKHPTIIKFIGYSKLDFQEENNVTIIMELAKNGSLMGILRQIQQNECPENYTNTTRQIILAGVARGIKYLHDRNIIHRDIKPENILLDENFEPHITDFGLSKFYEVGHSYSQTKFGGTLIYKAPEILKEQKYDGKVDVYSFAILMFEVLTDSVPYPELMSGEMPEYQFINKVINQGYRPKFDVPIKDSLRNLIEQCWSENPSERPTFDEIFNKLANKTICEENFLLEEVDTDKLNLYVKSVTEITDSTEKLLSKISQLEEDNRQLKSENAKLKDETIKQSEKSKQNEIKMIVGGYDCCGALIEHGKDNSNIIPPQVSSIDPSSILSFSIHYLYAVIVTKSGSMLKTIFYSSRKGKIGQFTEISIKDDSGSKLTPISAFCGPFFTISIFINSSGRKKLVCFQNIYKPLFLDTGDVEPVSLFGSSTHAAAISDKGEVIFINDEVIKKYSPNSRFPAVSLPDGEKASSVACMSDSVIVLSSNGRVFSSKIESESCILKFSPVSELSGYEIVWVSAASTYCLAVSKDGSVFKFGFYLSGQFNKEKGAKSTKSFTKISSLSGYKIRAAYSGVLYTLFETQEGKILSCGSNKSGELLLSSGPSEEKVLLPTETTITGGATFCVTGLCTSVVFVGGDPPPNMPNLPVKYNQ